MEDTIDLKNFVSFESRYVIRRTLTYSRSGKLYEAYDLQLERLVCIKEIESIQNLKTLEDTNMYNEIYVYRQIDYPCFLNILDSKFDPETSIKIVFDFYANSSNLFEYYHRNKLNLYSIFTIVKQVCHAVCYLHKNGMVHGDINPHNVLVVEHKMHTTDREGNCSHHTDTILYIKLIGMNGTKIMVKLKGIDMENEQETNNSNINTIKGKGNAPNINIDIDINSDSGRKDKNNYNEKNQNDKDFIENQNNIELNDNDNDNKYEEDQINNQNKNQSIDESYNLDNLINVSNSKSNNIDQQENSRVSYSSNSSLMDYENEYYLNHAFHKVEGVSGNVFYSAPEMYSEQSYSAAADVFAIGVLFFWLVTGKHPYEPLTEKGRVNMLVNSVNGIGHLDLLSSCPVLVKELLLKMLQVDPYVRCDMNYVIEHSWFIEMEKLSYYQLRRLVVHEEMEAKVCLEQLYNTQFRNELCKLIYFYMSDLYFDKVKNLKVGKIFQKIDTDADGKISKEDLMVFFKRFYNPNESLKKVTKIFANIDLNHSDSIEFGEFKVCGIAINEMDVQNKMLRLFKLRNSIYKNVQLDEIMCVIQDGNKDWGWFKLKLGNIIDIPQCIDKSEYIRMLQQMVCDIKNWHTQDSKVIIDDV